MAMSLFGKKPPDKEPSGSGARRADKNEITTTMDLTNLGDMGRALAAAAGKIQVSEGSSHEDHAAVEEAAILYANASEDGACAVLEAAIDGAIGKASEELWLMLFDLYRLTNQKAAFDARSEQFTQTYEISPPIWDEATPAPAAERRQSAPAVNLSGTLSGNARPQFEQLARIGQKMGKLRVELSRLKGIDDSGCELLNETLATLKRNKTEIVLFGAAHAIKLIEPKVKVGEKENQPYWMLMLSLIQQTADGERFDNVALDYAITFEESPPSYEPPPVIAPEEMPEAAAAPEPDVDRLAITGVVAGNQPEALRHIAVYAGSRSRVELDCTQLKRLEFVSAGALFNQIAQLQSQGKHTLIYRPNAMVAALLRVMGIDQVAQIERRKA